MKALIVDKLYTVWTVGINIQEKYFKYQGQEGCAFFTTEKHDPPSEWIAFSNWKEIPETKFEPYTLETFPLANQSGMVRNKNWDAKCFGKILATHGSEGLVVQATLSNKEAIYWKELCRNWEWLEVSGETTPFGRRI